MLSFLFGVYDMNDQAEVSQLNFNSDGQILNSCGQILNSDGKIFNSCGQIFNSSAIFSTHVDKPLLIEICKSWYSLTRFVIHF